MANAKLANAGPSSIFLMSGAKPGKKIKMTFYMTPDMYLGWKRYAFEKMQGGEKVSFQGVVEKHMHRILG